MTGLTRSATHDYRWNDGEKVPGVTSVIKLLDKSGPLVGWAKKETAECAVRNLTMLNEMVATGGPKAAVEWLKRIPDFQRDTAADLGTRIHTLAEALARKEAITVEPEEAPFIESYMKWLTDKRPKIVNVEYMVYSEKHRYGGTADVAFHLDGELWSVDYKTGKSTYSETAMQLAGLNGADWAGKAGDPKKYAIPKATKFGVLHIRPEGAELVPYQVTPAEFRAFIACRHLHTWVAERAPVVKGEVELVKAA